MTTVQSIPEFYSGQKIFITGGTGFMGKVLIEKLLRSCPDLHTIYLLIRPKKGKQSQDRIQDLTKQALFDTIRQNEPGAFDKLRAIAGDVKELGLGLSSEDKEMLHREVSVVFHSAASVRFDEPINDAVLLNVRGTREVVNFALGMQNLKVFLYVSTAYSNVCQHRHVVEKIYPPPNGWDWNVAIKMVEMEGAKDYVDCLMPKMLGRLIPNSYVFTKALAEQIINDHRDRLPLVLVRPSIVVGAFEEPLTGWTDNLNGPYGLWVSVYTGFMKTMHSKGSVALDYVPVDTAVKSMIVIAWRRAISNLSIDSHLPVYNCTSMWEMSSQEYLHEIMTRLFVKNPTSKMIWYPRCIFTESWANFYLHIIFFHVPFGILLDAVKKYNGIQPMFVKTYRRIYFSTASLYCFTSIHFTFDNTEFIRLADDMPISDRDDFDYSKVWKKDDETVEMIVLGLRTNLLQDPIETLPQARRKVNRLYWLDRSVTWAFYSAIIWAVTKTNTFHSIAALFS